MSDREWVTIGEVAEASGLSVDTLRWYEKEGMLPRVERGSDGRRRYSPADVSLVLLLARLRDTGMTTHLMKEFVTLLGEGAASHGRRISLLAETRIDLEARHRALDDALAALDHKVAHYEELIDAGLDCDGRPVPPAIRERQRNRRPTLRKDTA